MTPGPPARGRDAAATRGITLIELVVAVAVLALGAAAAWRSLDAAGRSAGGQAERALAQEVALNRAADLRLAAPGTLMPAVERLGGIDWTVTQTTAATAGGLAQTEIAVAAPGRAGARLTVWLPAGPP